VPYRVPLDWKRQKQLNQVVDLEESTNDAMRGDFDLVCRFWVFYFELVWLVKNEAV